jgi:glycosyltransferase involved in cell wall biosynthesis
VWSNARAIIANSEGLKALARKTFKGKINVIPNGVDIREFKPISRKPNKPLRIISTGRLTKRKAYHNLILAMQGLQNVELVLIGEGVEKKRLLRLAKKLNVRITFKGILEREEVCKELQKGDLFVLPSLNEGMSNSVLEAMACGLPTIVTDVGGSKELVKGNGFIVKRNCPEDLRNALLRYDYKLRKEHGDVSVKIARGMDWKSVAGRYVSLYIELAETGDI